MFILTPQLVSLYKLLGVLSNIVKRAYKEDGFSIYLDKNNNYFFCPYSLDVNIILYDYNNMPFMSI